MNQPKTAIDLLIDINDKLDLLLKYNKTLDVNLKKILNRSISQDSNTITTSIAKPLAPILTVESAATNGNVIKASNIDFSNKKEAVSQNLCYKSDNKNVTLAKVLAYDKSNNIAGETKTNMHGKWILMLRPGEYIIHILKAGTKTPPRPTLDIKYNITVNNNSNNNLGQLEI